MSARQQYQGIHCKMSTAVDSVNNGKSFFQSYYLTLKLQQGTQGGVFHPSTLILPQTINYFIIVPNE